MPCVCTIPFLFNLVYSQYKHLEKQIWQLFESSNAHSRKNSKAECVNLMSSDNKAWLFCSIPNIYQETWVMGPDVSNMTAVLEISK